MKRRRMIVWETANAVGGGQRMTLQIMELLRDRYDFLCLIPGEGRLARELRERDIPYAFLGDMTLPAGVKGLCAALRYAGMSLRCIAKSIRCILRFRPDVLYAPGPAALPWSAICGALTGRPVIWHLHHIFRDGGTKHLLKLCARMRAVRSVIAVSECAGRQLGGEKIRVAYNPVDYASHSCGYAERARAEMEATLGRRISEECILLLQVASISRSKRQDRLIDLVAALRGMGRDAVGVALGDAASREDAGYKEELLQRIRGRGLENAVWLPGFREEVADFLAACDCLFVPSEEGLSLAAMEAMAAGRHVAAMAGSGTEELLRRADCGTLFPVDADAGEMAGAVLRAMEEDAGRIESGRRFCMKNSPAAYGRRIAELFEEAMR